MNHPNPTPLRIGMVGVLFGKRYRVAGRVVLGMEEAGKTYYWNEFNLVNMENESTDLVFESTEQGGEWRLFVMFEPAAPFTAADAATKRVGDRLNLEGTEVTITLVSQSRIYHIEGQGSEGEEVGDLARYFNAKGGDNRIVVSWTGEEIECYRGGDISYASVRSAFNLPGEAPSGLARSLVSANAAPSSGPWLKLVYALLAAAVLMVALSFWRSKPPSGALITISAPSPPLKPGTTITINGTPWGIAGHSLVEITQVGLRSERHEYQLLDQNGNSALLIYGFDPGITDWFFFTPVEPLIPLTPQAAAVKRLGEMINLDGEPSRVSALFQSAIRQTETAETAGLDQGTISYGFTAQSASTVLLVRWSNAGITFHRGKRLPSKEVAAAPDQAR